VIILDENFVESQRQILQGWRISFRQVGFEVGREGLKDQEIIPLLHQLRQPTFFTLDSDFFKGSLCHHSYCLVYLDVAQYEAAAFVCRTIRHKEFDTKVKRMGTVMRVSHVGLAVWRLHAQEQVLHQWT
jgi:hypothetical protein